MMVRTALALLLVLVAGPALAERTQVYSIQGADCAQCFDKIRDELKKVKGARKPEFDRRRVELTLTLADGVSDGEVLAAVQRAGLTAVVGPGKGAWLAGEAFPADADFAVLSKAGEAVGALEKLRVPGKFTVFDVYADWCGPCKLVDAHLREIAGKRKDVAVRKLNIVDFDTPLARELGDRVEALPYVIVFSPTGKRGDVEGADRQKLEKLLR